MDITIRGKHNHVPKALQEFAVDKSQHLGRFLSTITSVDIELYEDGKPRDGKGMVAHITVSTTGPVFRAKATTDDFHLSIDTAVARLERRVKEFKRKRSGRPAHGKGKRPEGSLPAKEPTE